MKEYKNEEWYQNAKKRILGIALIIFAAGLLLGFTSIIIGKVKINNAKKQYAEYKEILRQETLKKQQEEKKKQEEVKEEQKEKKENTLTEEEKTAKKAEIEAKIKELEAEKAKLEEEKNQSSSDIMKSLEIAQKIIEVDGKIFDLKDELDDLEEDEFVVEDSTSEFDKEIQNKFFNAFGNIVSSMDDIDINAGDIPSNFEDIYKTNSDYFNETMQDPIFNKLFGILGTKLNDTVEYTFTTGRYIIFYIIGYIIISITTIGSVAFYFLAMNSEIEKHSDKKEETISKKEEVKEETTSEKETDTKKKTTKKEEK